MGSALVYKLIGYLNYDIWFSCHANRVIDAPGALHHIIARDGSVENLRFIPQLKGNILSLSYTSVSVLKQQACFKQGGL